MPNIRILLACFAVAATVATPALAAPIPQFFAKLTPGDADSGDVFGFGTSLEMQGGLIVVGTPFDNTNGTASGSAYLFNTNGDQIAKLSASDSAPLMEFGTSVATDGNRVLVGAPGTATQILPGQNDEASKGAAYLFDSSGAQLRKFTAGDAALGDFLGFSVALDGERALIGSPTDDNSGTNSGSAYLFDTASGAELRKFTASDGQDFDLLGYSVNLNGERVFVGARNDDDNAANGGSVYIFDHNGNELGQFAPDSAGDGDFFGYNIAIDGDRLAISAPHIDSSNRDVGRAFVFAVDGTELLEITPGDESTPRLFGDGSEHDWFGREISLFGDYILVGAPDESSEGTGSGAAFLFSAQSGELLRKIVAPDVDGRRAFGNSVAMYGDMLAIGARNADGGVGAVYLYRLTEDVPAPPAATLVLAGMAWIAWRRRRRS